ncbi:O-antigen ligase family protein [Acinetobacter radioresistens]|uniref:O-antigen ligase family protein n=1 Tax=Acinetobacter radioresistens TaxID=40216 RepID=UPI0022474FDC|nr:O-antigen ligase family protein [Acinetobacter radioresistens]MCX0332277.1 O-antigen ligase family protein [Acinetobacter radioresistens]
MCLYSDIKYLNLDYFNWIYFFKYLTYFFTIIFGFICGLNNILEKSIVKKVLFICLGINFLWMLLQLATGNYIVLLGANEAASYGIKMVAEGAAFQVGSVLSLIIFTLILLYFKLKNNFYKFLLIALLFLNFYFLFLTESRVNLLGSLVGLILIVIRKINWLSKIIFIFLSLILLNLILVLGGVKINFENNRFTIAGIWDSYNVRGQEIWAQPLEIISKNIFTGEGLGALTNFNQNTNEMHNYYLKLLFEGGFFYFIIFIIFIIFILFFKKNNLYINFDYILLLKIFTLSLAISAFVQDSFSSNKAVIPMFFLLGYCIAINICFQRKKVDE